jgi:hypothetical protein
MTLDALLALLESLDSSDVPAQSLIIADWLGEHGEADLGWRALGTLRIYPEMAVDLISGNPPQFWFWPGNGHDPVEEHTRVDSRWYVAIGGIKAVFPSRAAAMSKASKAFTELPEDVQREILSRGSPA